MYLLTTQFDNHNNMDFFLLYTEVYTPNVTESPSHQKSLLNFYLVSLYVCVHVFERKQNIDCHFYLPQHLRGQSCACPWWPLLDSTKQHENENHFN